jgi:hypothetical protein
MARHYFNLRYGGLLATHNELASSASKQAIEGAQMFLGAHAHYFLSGRIPQRINDKTPGYEITDLARAANSWEAEFAINIFAEEKWDIDKYAFPVLIYDSYRAWAQGRVYEDPPVVYRDPHVGTCSVQVDPPYDPDQRHQQERLYHRVGRAVAHMTAGIGTSASMLELTIDDHMFAIIDRRVPFVTEDEVTEGVSLFRQTVDAAKRRRLN